MPCTVRVVGVPSTLPAIITANTTLIYGKKLLGLCRQGHIENINPKMLCKVGEQRICTDTAYLAPELLLPYITCLTVDALGRRGWGADREQSRWSYWVATVVFMHTMTTVPKSVLETDFTFNGLCQITNEIWDGKTTVALKEGTPTLKWWGMEIQVSFFLILLKNSITTLA